MDLVNQAMSIITKLNMFDIGVIVVLIISMAACYDKGLVMSLMGLISGALAIFIAIRFYPVVSEYFKNSEFIYGFTVSKLTPLVNMEVLTGAAPQNLGEQSSIINALGLPALITDKLVNNNNPEIYRLLGVDQLGQYIVRYVAGLALDAAAFLVVFTISILAIGIFANALNIAAKLPVINTLNKAGGAAIGIIQGVFIIWVLMLVMLALFSRADYIWLYSSLNKSVFASKLFDANIILRSMY